MAWITKEGRTVDEAQQAAVSEAGRPVEELEVEVVSEGAKGLFGLGGEPAVVRVRPRDEAADVRQAFHDGHGSGERPPRAEQPTARTEGDVAVADEVLAAPEDGGVADLEAEDEPWQESPEGGSGVLGEADADEGQDEDHSPEEERLPLTEQQEQAAALGAEIVKGVMERMELDGDVQTRISGGTVYVEVFGEGMGILIGRSGATLEALQEIVRAGVQRRLKTRQAVVVDVEAYWERRRKERGGGRRGSGGGGRGGRGRGRGSGGRGPNRNS